MGTVMLAADGRQRHLGGAGLLSAAPGPHAQREALRPLVDVLLSGRALVRPALFRCRGQASARP